MNDPVKKANPEETPKDEKLQLTDSEAENAAGGMVLRKINSPMISSKTPFKRG